MSTPVPRDPSRILTDIAAGFRQLAEGLGGPAMAAAGATAAQKLSLLFDELAANARVPDDARPDEHGRLPGHDHYGCTANPCRRMHVRGKPWR